MVSVYVRMTETKGKKGSEEVRKLLAKALCVQYPALQGVWEKGLPLMGKNAYGKPYFPGYPEIYFNLSHTAGCVCCALADAPVGVDVEQCRPRKNLERIVGRFSAGEQKLWQETPEAMRQQLFFALWVLKESCVKADGRGLRIPLDAFSVEPAGWLGESLYDAVRAGTALYDRSGTGPEEWVGGVPWEEWTGVINASKRTDLRQEGTGEADRENVCYHLHLYPLQGPYQIAACCERAGFSGPFLVE